MGRASKTGCAEPDQVYDDALRRLVHYPSALVAVPRIQERCCSCGLQTEACRIAISHNFLVRSCPFGSGLSLCSLHCEAVGFGTRNFELLKKLLYLQGHKLNATSQPFWRFQVLAYWPSDIFSTSDLQAKTGFADMLRSLDSTNCNR